MLISLNALDSGPYSRVYPFNMPQVLDRATSTMQIGEVAKLTALTVDAIRFYERRALLPKAPRTVGRFRLYTNDDVARLGFIRQMQSLGFYLTEIRQLLELREHHLDACLEVKNLLKTKLEKVQSKVRELKQLERELALDLRKCNGELKHRQGHTPRQCPILISANGEKRDVPC
jgi:DNA-binding transcriptional MerR regulator